MFLASDGGIEHFAQPRRDFRSAADSGDFVALLDFFHASFGDPVGNAVTLIIGDREFGVGLATSEKDES